MNHELALVIACCGWPPSPARTRKVEAASSHNVDWDKVLDIARLHRVEGLVHHALSGTALALPEPVSVKLRKRATAIAANGLRFAAQSVSLQARFFDAAIPMLTLKGAAIAMLAYRNLSIKSAWDIDILVASGDVARAEALLDQLGYHRTVPPPHEDVANYAETWKESVWHCSADQPPVELHWRVANNRFLLPKLTVNSATQEVDLGADRVLTTFADDALFAYLCVHGASHGWWRLKWLADLAAWLAEKPPSEIARLYRAAVETGAGRCPAQALLLCHRLFDTDIDTGLLGELRRDRKVRLLEWIARECITGGDGRTELSERRIIARGLLMSEFLLASGWNYAHATFRERWSSQATPLPAPLRFLSPITRIALAIWRLIAR